MARKSTFWSPEDMKERNGRVGYQPATRLYSNIMYVRYRVMAGNTN